MKYKLVIPWPVKRDDIMIAYAIYKYDGQVKSMQSWDAIFVNYYQFKRSWLQEVKEPKNFDEFWCNTKEANILECSYEDAKILYRTARRALAKEIKEHWNIIQNNYPGDIEEQESSIAITKILSNILE